MLKPNTYIFRIYENAQRQLIEATAELSSFLEKPRNIDAEKLRHRRNKVAQWTHITKSLEDAYGLQASDVKILKKKKKEIDTDQGVLYGADDGNSDRSKRAKALPVFDGNLGYAGKVRDPAGRGLQHPGDGRSDENGISWD